MEIRGEGAELAPGTYTYSEFAPGVTFVLDEGWTGAHLFPEFFDVLREGLLLAFADPEYVVDKKGTRVETEDLTPREALETLLGIDDLEAGPIREATVGDRSGLVVDFTPSVAARLFGGPEGTFSATAGERHRLAAVDVEGELVLVMIRGPAEAFEAGLADAEAVLDTVQLG